jgi:FkbM family methyltransferase
MSIDNREKSAVLDLIQYFGEHWVIYDVGANKGQWSDILINERDQSTKAGQYTVHFFEPNELLINYLTVKHEYNDHVVLNKVAIWKENDAQRPFYYFTNRNNGLSSLYDNPKWDTLPKQRGETLAITLDFYAKNREDIDIIKIDVEGAEYDVLIGAEKLLQQKRVKVIQIEYSEHYQLTGRTFQDVIDYVGQFGYHAYSWDGEYFHKIDRDNFKEDYRLDNFFLTYLPIGRYNYTQLWNGEFIKNTNGLGKVSFALEIGCFEGLTTNYICDHILQPDGRIICVDPLEDRYLPTADEQTNQMFVGQYERFIKNTKGKPVELLRMKSQDAFPLLKDYLFDFVYIDGDHSKSAVYNDAVSVFTILRKNGYILFDDYKWKEETKEGIDQFLNEYQDQIRIAIKDYQVLIRKK